MILRARREKREMTNPVHFDSQNSQTSSTVHPAPSSRQFEWEELARASLIYRSGWAVLCWAEKLLKFTRTPGTVLPIYQNLMRTREGSRPRPAYVVVICFGRRPEESRVLTFLTFNKRRDSREWKGALPPFPLSFLVAPSFPPNTRSSGPTERREAEVVKMGQVSHRLKWIVVIWWD